MGQPIKATPRDIDELILESLIIALARLRMANQGYPNPKARGYKKRWVKALEETKRELILGSANESAEV